MRGTSSKLDEKSASQVSSLTNIDEPQRKQGSGQTMSNVYPYPTIVKQINLITSNTPTSVGKPPLHTNATPTPQHVENGKINFENLKANALLNIQSVKEGKKFEFPTYLNNYTCERKHPRDSTSFTLDVHKPQANEDKRQKYGKHAELGRQTPSRQRNASEEQKPRKHTSEICDSP